MKEYALTTSDLSQAILDWLKLHRKLEGKRFNIEVEIEGKAALVKVEKVG